MGRVAQLAHRVGSALCPKKRPFLKNNVAGEQLVSLTDDDLVAMKVFHRGLLRGSRRLNVCGLRRSTSLVCARRCSSASWT